MSNLRFVSATFLLFGLGNLFAGCVAAGKPPGAYASNTQCTSTLQCKFIPLPPCTTNMKQCFEGRCLISDVPNCVPAPPTTATATVGPVPTVSPTVVPSTPPPGSNPTPTAPN